MKRVPWKLECRLICFRALCICQLLDILYREETLLNVVRSVTKNGRSILLTAVLGVILIYLFSIVGFIFFQDDFMIEVNPLAEKKGSFPSFCSNISFIF